jgi:hypothetical protein
MWCFLFLQAESTTPKDQYRVLRRFNPIGTLFGQQVEAGTQGMETQGTIDKRTQSMGLF